ncbi:MAG: hypothetical protein J7L89_04925, partial [Bacteroidales bacterium]|nr:hypothetical protein [Bacteroidales bacterium]
CGVPQITTMDSEEQEFATRFHRFIHTDNFELIIRDLEEAIYHIGMNANPKILFTDLSFRLRTFLKMSIPAGD